jgi:hypothetical protein
MRLFLLSTLGRADDRTLIAPMVDDSACEVERLRAASKTRSSQEKPVLRCDVDPLAGECSLRHLEARRHRGLRGLNDLDSMPD